MFLQVDRCKLGELSVEGGQAAARAVEHAIGMYALEQRVRWLTGSISAICAAIT